MISRSSTSFVLGFAPVQNIRFGKAQAASWLFCLMAAFFLAWPLWRMGFPMELDRNEAWNAWHADAVLNGTPLYPDKADLIVNNYPPLSFYITAFVSALTGDTICAGRLLSVLSLLVVSVAAGSCIHSLCRSRRAAAFGASWLLATFSHAFVNYIGMYDPGMLGLAIMGVALAMFLSQVEAGKPVQPAIALMVLAGFVKHTMFATPLAALIWLALGNKPGAVRAAAFGGALCGAGLLLCIIAFGPNFAAQMLMPRHMSFEHLFANINKLQWIGLACVCWGLWAWPNKKEPSAQFTALLLGLSVAIGLALTAGSGVVYNAYFEAFFASAIAVALAFRGIGSTWLARRYGAGPIHTVMIAALVLRLLLSQQSEPYLMFFSANFRQAVLDKAEIVNTEVERIKAIDGPVSCSTISICYLAGKPFVYDRFWMKEKLLTGLSTREEINQAVLERGIRFEDTLPQVVGEMRPRRSADVQD